MLTGVPLNTPDFEGRTCLHWAVALDIPQLVSMLSRSGANPFFEDDTGLTPIHLAVKCDATDCIEMIAHSFTIKQVSWSYIET